MSVPVTTTSMRTSPSSRALPTTTRNAAEPVSTSGATGGLSPHRIAIIASMAATATWSRLLFSCPRECGIASVSCCYR